MVEKQQQKKQQQQSEQKHEATSDVEIHAVPAASDTADPEAPQLKRTVSATSSMLAIGMGLRHLATELEASIIEEDSVEETKELLKEDSSEEAEKAEK